MGIIIDEKLTFSDHCARVKNKLLFCNYTVLRARNFLRRSQLLSYYKTHVNPIVQYSVLIYGCTSYSNLDPVLKIQKRIVRSICFLPKYASVHQFLVENELPTVYELHVYELLKTIIGCVRSEHVHDEKECYLQFSDVGIGLRSVTRREVFVPFGKTKKLNHSLCKRVSELYNKLVKVSMLPDCTLIRSMSDEVGKHFRHNFLRNFILGNRNLVDFVFGKKIDLKRSNTMLYLKVVIALGKTGLTQPALCGVCWVLPCYEPYAKQVLYALFTLGLHGSLWEFPVDTRFTTHGICIPLVKEIPLNARYQTVPDLFFYSKKSLKKSLKNKKN